MTITYHAIPHADLTLGQLYALLALRAEVFVVEQDCPYQDLDGKDQKGIHLLGYAEDGRLATYTRLLPRGVPYADYASIGRVVTAPFARGKGLGRELMAESVRRLFTAYGEGPVKISAQAHLQDFYGSCGFTGVGEIYDEDGIPHRGMVYTEKREIPTDKS